MAKKSVFVFIGIIVGLWISWPGIMKSDSWRCAMKIINQSNRKGTSLRALIAISPKYFLSRESYKGGFGKTRIIGDACFR